MRRAAAAERPGRHLVGYRRIERLVGHFAAATATAATFTLALLSAGLAGNLLAGQTAHGEEAAPAHRFVRPAESAGVQFVDPTTPAARRAQQTRLRWLPYRPASATTVRDEPLDDAVAEVERPIRRLRYSRALGQRDDLDAVDPAAAYESDDPSADAEWAFDEEELPEGIAHEVFDGPVLDHFVRHRQPDPFGEFDAQPPSPFAEEPRTLEEQIAQVPSGRFPPCPRPEDLKRISEITNVIAPDPGDFPPECTLGDAPYMPRMWGMTEYTWKAAGLCHKPLYFEEVALERYGHMTGPLTQPFVSGAHFFLTLPILPYKMGIDPPWECVYPLGYYRPGSCAPYMIYPFPLSLRGAAVQAAATTGAVFLIP